MITLDKVSLYLYSLILILYYIFTFIYPEGHATEAQRFIPQVLMTIIALFSILIIIKNIRYYFSNTIFLPFLLYIIYQLPYIFHNNDYTIFQNFIFYLKQNLAIFSIFAWFYYATVTNNKTKKCFYIILTFQILYSLLTLYQDYSIQSIESDFIDSNIGFILVCCIPSVLLIPKTRVKTFLYLILTLGCLVSGQRAAALVAIVILPFCFKNLSLKRNDIFILLLLSIVFIFPVLEKAIENIMYRNNIDIDSGSMGSGRSIFWKIVWDTFWKGDSKELLFGNGYGSVHLLLKVKYGMAIGAHNGWLDNLFSFGIIGFLLFLYTNLILLFNNNKFNNYLTDYKNILLIIFIFLFVRSSVSHGFWDVSTIPLGMCLGLVIAKYFENKENENNLSM